ncbi:MAG: pilus assembly protein PilM [Acidobacteriota bacterium]
MAFLGKPLSFLGIDLGTSSIKMVELLNRKKRIEVATYAHAPAANPLLAMDVPSGDTITATTNILRAMIDKSQVSSDAAIASLPASAVFSTVIELPNLPDDGQMDKAVRFAAGNVVPADLQEMVLGWSRASEKPHMAVGEKKESAPLSTSPGRMTEEGPVSIFLTAAPKALVDRYLETMKRLTLRLVALEVETFPLARSLLGEGGSPALIADIGDMVTTFHIIDNHTPRVSYSIDVGGHHITAAIAAAVGVTPEEAERVKKTFGLSQQKDEKIKAAIQTVVYKYLERAQHVVRSYQKKEGRGVKESILIGGGALLVGLREYWAQTMGHTTRVGNPWKGLSYPESLQGRLEELGPTYGVAVGLALRGFDEESK